MRVVYSYKLSKTFVASLTVSASAHHAMFHASYRKLKRAYYLKEDRELKAKQKHMQTLVSAEVA